MLLTSLKLKDFRQFKGEQTINFAAGSDKNVTIILGENGSGKTSLAQAFTWCLYGKTDFDDPILLCKATSQTMLPGKEEIVSAELQLTHGGIGYTNNFDWGRTSTPDFFIAHNLETRDDDFISYIISKINTSFSVFSTSPIGQSEISITGVNITLSGSITIPEFLHGKTVTW